jgi:hypothetical protein
MLTGILYTSKLGMCTIAFDEFVIFSLDIHEHNFLNDRYLKLYCINRKIVIFKKLVSVFEIIPTVDCQKCCQRFTNLVTQYTASLSNNTSVNRILLQIRFMSPSDYHEKPGSKLLNVTVVWVAFLPDNQET